MHEMPTWSKDMFPSFDTWSEIVISRGCFFSINMGHPNRWHRASVCRPVMADATMARPPKICGRAVVVAANTGRHTIAWCLQFRADHASHKIKKNKNNNSNFLRRGVQHGRRSRPRRNIVVHDVRLSDGGAATEGCACRWAEPQMVVMLQNRWQGGGGEQSLSRGWRWWCKQDDEQEGDVCDGDVDG